MGYILGAGSRLDLELYSDSTFEFGASSGSGNGVFGKKDRVFGKGYGLGMSFLSGRFLLQILYQSFQVSDLEVSEVEYSVEDDEISSFRVQSLCLNVGVFFF